MKRTLLLFTVLACCLGIAPARAACPENMVSAGCYPDAVGLVTTDATATFGQSGIESWSAGQPCNTGCYDLPAGVLMAKGSVNPYGGCVGGVQVKDDYQIVGPPGPPLAFEALLQVHAVLVPHTGYSASIAVGGLSAECHDQADCEAAIALSFAPGVTFTLQAQLFASGEVGVFPFGDGVATGTIRFRGLPEGYNMVSCQHYDVPVPAHPATWGGVKALYR